MWCMCTHVCISVHGYRSRWGLGAVDPTGEAARPQGVCHSRGDGCCGVAPRPSSASLTLPICLTSPEPTKWGSADDKRMPSFFPSVWRGWPSSVWSRRSAASVSRIAGLDLLPFFFRVGFLSWPLLIHFSTFVGVSSDKYLH